MPSLIVPRSGLPLDFASKPGAAERMIALTLTDDAIENMIKCIGDGQEIQLSYRAESTISYGTNTLRFTTSQDNVTYDIYQNTVASSNSPNTPEISKGPRKSNNCKLAYMGSTAAFLTPRGHKATKPKESVAMSRQVSQNSAKAKNETAGMDHALETLKSTLAAETARKAANTTQKASTQLPPDGQKRGQAARDRAAAKAMGGGVAAAKRALGRSIGSIPTSPALNASSPALAPTSVPASETAAEKTKAIRAPIIHRLAIGPATDADLLKYKTSNATDWEFKSAIEKVADLKDGKYTLRPKLYRELDVWNFKYTNQKERQTAIDSAVRQFDKMRLSASELEWQLLYPVEERGKGNTLSKVQAKIALNGPVGMSKPRPAADSEHGTDEEDDDLFGGPPAGKRPTNGVKTKAQRERDAQDKRLSGKATAKQKATTARAAPAKKEAAPKSSAGGKKSAAPSSSFKSSEFVNDSDEEEHEAYVPQAAKKAAPSKKRKSDEDLSGSPPKKAKPAAASSSSSSQSGKSTSQQTARSTQSSQPTQKISTVASVQRSINQARSKIVTSPKKSSPLASSPPVSASDLEDDKSTSVSPAAPTKRKLANADRDGGDVKGRKEDNGRQGLSAELQADTDRFTVLYGKYESLYRELEKKETREDRDMERLRNMERKLRELKGRIVEVGKA